jgi:hypothetical protein
MNTDEILAAVRALPELPTVYAKSMLQSQGWSPTAKERAAINARREFFRLLEMPEGVHVDVRYTFEPHEVIGTITF